jgi:hypothetical protein
MFADLDSERCGRSRPGRVKEGSGVFQHALSSWMGEGLAGPGLAPSVYGMETVCSGWGILSMSLNLPRVTEPQQFTLTNFSHLICFTEPFIV